MSTVHAWKSKRSYLSATLTLLVLTAACGCGRGNLEERAHAQRDQQLAAWDNREGLQWTAYAKGWRTGWMDGCSAADEKAWRVSMPASERYNPLLSGASRCGLPPDPDDNLVPTYPPDFPLPQGHEDGFGSGCWDAYEYALDKAPPSRFCERLALAVR